MSDQLESYQQPSVLSEVDGLRKEVSRGRKYLLITILIIFGLIAILFRSSGNAISTFVPAQVKQSFWVSHDAVSDSYLEEMALYVQFLAENYTPKNITYKHEKLLEIANPQFFGALQKKLMARAEYAKNNNVSQTFHPSATRIDTKTMTVRVIGSLRQWVNDEELPLAQRAIDIKFAYDGGFISVVGINPVK